MRGRPSLVLSLLIMALTAWAVIAATAWPWKAALFPLVIGIPVFFMAVTELILSLTHPEGEAPAERPDFQLSAHLPEDVTTRRTLAIFAWVLGFFCAILLLGFLVAVPLFVFLYLTLQGREGWGLSLALALAAWGFFYGLFVHLLHLPFPAGWIQTWLGIQ